MPAVSHPWGPVVAWSLHTPPKGQPDMQCGLRPPRPALCREKLRNKTKWARTQALASFLPAL